MFSISNNGIVRVTRGDTFTLSIDINIGSQLEPILYELQEGDKVYFGLMEPNKPFERAIVRKMFTKDDQDLYKHIEMKFSTQDTEYLMPGNYYYMVKLVRTSDGGELIVDTIVNKTKFIILD